MRLAALALVFVACSNKPAEAPASSAPVAPQPAPPTAPLASAPVEAPKSDAYECSLLLGLKVTGEWFNAGFEQVVDGNRWEAILRPHTFVQDWADPNHAAWSEVPVSPCAAHPTEPDRVLLVLANWDLQTREQWVEVLKRAVATIGARYPKARAIELLTMIRAPGNATCGDPKSVVSPFIDEAVAEVSASSSGLVKAGPKFEMKSCDVFEKGGPHFTPDGGAVAARMIGEHYAAR